ncbi:MAG: molybdopterin molybdotransferase [Bacteroidia bacterium]|jgi:molybdopterin molybdotransferase
MISVQQADAIILDHTQSFGLEIIPFENSLGRILGEDIYADRDFPPFDRVAMDGICVRFEDYKAGQRLFPIGDIQAAGEPQKTLDAGNAIEIMTGATLCHKADTVIRYEDLKIDNKQATILIDDVRFEQNVHKRGTDRPVNDLLLKQYSKINATAIGVLATVGKSTVSVLKLPKVVIISTGDELVDIDQKPLPHQIRKSNVHTLKAILNAQNISADLVHLSDDKSDIRTKLTSILTTYDVVLMSGAVSKGKFDFIPELLDELKVEKHFHRVEQRPGKPFWFGIKDTTCVFAFPGNPVSTFLCAIRFFEPWLKKSLQQQPIIQHAYLAEEVYFKPNLTYFLQVNISNANGKVMAEPVKGNGSGDLANLTVADAFLELPSDRTDFKSGEVFEFWSF